MWRWLLVAAGVFLGGALGLLGPVFAVTLMHLGSSYEDVMFIWLATLPCGVALGTWLGFRVGSRIDARRRP